MDASKDAWNDGEIKAGIEETTDGPIGIQLAVHIISLLQRGVIALETIAKAHGPQALLVGDEPTSDGLGVMGGSARPHP